MSSPREGTARALVYAQLAKAGKNEVSAAELARAAHGKHNRAAIDQALAKGVRCGDVVKVAYGRYKLASNDSATRPAVPPPGAKSAPHSVGGEALTPSLGRECAVLPENRSQGTIAQALRAVLTADVPLSLDEIFLALPIGWSRTDAISGLKEGALDGWVNFGPDGWQLVGEPPETEAESPLSVARIPNYSQHRLQEISGDLRAQLYDAVTLQKESALIRALAISYDEVGKALAIVSD